MGVSLQRHVGVSHLCVSQGVHMACVCGCVYHRMDLRFLESVMYGILVVSLCVGGVWVFCYLPQWCTCQITDIERNFECVRLIVKGAWDKNNIIPLTFSKTFSKKVEIFIPLQVLLFVMTTCQFLPSSYF